MQKSDIAYPVRIDTRLAGQVKRYHTWPIIGQQTIAEHTWQLLRIYLAVTEAPDIGVMQFITFHDIGEHSTGDLPYPVKKENPALKELIDTIEWEALDEQLKYWDTKFAALSQETRYFIKLIEMIEMAEFGLDQMNLGNGHGFIVADRCLKSVFLLKPSWPRFIKYVTTRLNLFKEQYSVGIGCDLDPWWKEDKWEELSYARK